MRQRVVKELADIAIACATGERGTGKYTGRRLSTTHDEIANSPSVCTSHAADRTATTSKIDCAAEQELVRHYA